MEILLWDHPTSIAYNHGKSVFSNNDTPNYTDITLNQDAGLFYALRFQMNTYQFRLGSRKYFATSIVMPVKIIDKGTVFPEPAAGPRTWSFFWGEWQDFSGTIPNGTFRFRCWFPNDNRQTVRINNAENTGINYTYLQINSISGIPKLGS